MHSFKLISFEPDRMRGMAQSANEYIYGIVTNTDS